jgi:hypothetical protein
MGRTVIGGGPTKKHIGYFHTLEQAIAARQAAEIKLLGCTVHELKDPEVRRALAPNKEFIRKV